MLERRMVAGAVAYSAVFLGDQVQVYLKDVTVPLGFVNSLEFPKLSALTQLSDYKAAVPKGSAEGSPRFRLFAVLWGSLRWGQPTHERVFKDIYDDFLCGNSSGTARKTPHQRRLLGMVI